MDPAALGGRRPRTVGNDEASDNETRPPSPMEAQEAPAEEQTTSFTTASIRRHMRDHDRYLPLANVARIMAKELAGATEAKVSGSAKALMQEAATEFICFIMSEANDLAKQEGRRSVSGKDLVNACDKLDMQEMVGTMTNALPHLAPPPRVRGKRGRGEDEELG